MVFTLQSYAVEDNSLPSRYSKYQLFPLYKFQLVGVKDVQLQLDGMSRHFDTVISWCSYSFAKLRRVLLSMHSRYASW